MHILVPELQYFISRFRVSRLLNKSLLDCPPEINPEHIGKASFIELLFSDEYNYTYYNYLFKELEPRTLWPLSFKTRLSPYAHYAKVYTSNSSGENLFQLTNDDLLMLNHLLEYKTTQMTDLSNIQFSYDSTSVTTILSTNLSRLIYIDLKFMLDKVTSIISVIPDSAIFPQERKILDLAYEEYVLEKHFQYLSEVSREYPPP